MFHDLLVTVDVVGSITPGDGPVDECLAVEIVLELVRSGLSPAEAVDYYAVEILEKRQGEWADARGIAQPSVSENVSKARKKLA